MPFPKLSQKCIMAVPKVRENIISMNVSNISTKKPTFAGVLAVLYIRLALNCYEVLRSATAVKVGSVRAGYKLWPGAATAGSRRGWRLGILSHYLRFELAALRRDMRLDVCPNQNAATEEAPPQTHHSATQKHRSHAHRRYLSLTATST